MDAYYDMVGCAYLDGSGVTTIAESPGSHFYDVQLSGDYLIAL